MRRLLVLLLTSITLLGQVAAADVPETNAQIKFRGMRHNFGKIQREGGPIRRVVFPFTNMGTEPLVIYMAESKCSCLSTTYTKTPIMPGQTGKVTVTVEPGNISHSIDRFEKRVTVRTNGSPVRSFLIVKGELTDDPVKTPKK